MSKNQSLNRKLDCTWVVTNSKQLANNQQTRWEKAPLFPTNLLSVRFLFRISAKHDCLSGL